MDILNVAVVKARGGLGTFAMHFVNLDYPACACEVS